MQKKFSKFTIFLKSASVYCAMFDLTIHDSDQVIE